MSANSPEKPILAHPPEELSEIKTGAPAESAAGLTAVASSFRHLLSRAGAVRSAEGMLGLNQKDGFDCPSCAWPDPDDHRSRFEFCENGAKALASETTLARVTPEFFAAHPVAELSRQTDAWHDRAGRITHPVVLRPGDDRYRAISWEDAFALVAEELNALASPHEAVFYTSGRASNEAAFSLRALRAPVRHEQPAGLLQHVPRVQRRGHEVLRGRGEGDGGL